jgi:ubiquinone/menaquinone biosynthesis C-methylase UbiE
VVDQKYKIAEFKLNQDKKQNGVYILSEINDEFESIYLKVREKERRNYSDAEIDKLPFASKLNPHKNEWSLRVKSFLRFKKYLKAKSENLKIVDLGCGNGWFSSNLSKNSNHNIFCVDVNLTELNQGARVFKSEKLKFIYANIFTADLPKQFFDLIILNASVQYFPDIKKLLRRLCEIITSTGEIHIIDSPFYSKNESVKAKKRTEDYYSSINFPEMSKHYHHHSYEILSEFNSKIHYDTSPIKNKLGKLFLIKDSPFPWIEIRQ